jgi:hypothetical protein
LLQQLSSPSPKDHLATHGRDIHIGTVRRRTKAPDTAILPVPNWSKYDVVLETMVIAAKPNSAMHDQKRQTQRHGAIAE